jgi:cytochrome d ubiquinol oxidase subunit II
LDGFDLGVGFWHLRARGDKNRRTLMRAVGPHWDGNEVWLVTGGGALFAAFPRVYATVFSGFYLAMILVIVALGLRAVSFEFRGKGDSSRWRGLWDAGFSIGSILAALLFGVALGNIMRGIPLDAEQYYAGTFWGLLNPYALLIGVLGVVMIAFHGALFTVVKTSGELMSAARGWASKMGRVYLVLFLAAAIVSTISQGHLLQNYNRFPILWVVPVLARAMIIGALVYHQRKRPGRAFVASSLSIVALMAMAAVGLFPRLVPALGAPELSLTAANASSSMHTLQVMLVVALIGMPLVIGYTLWVYRAFAGKVDLEAEPEGY